MSEQSMKHEQNGISIYRQFIGGAWSDGQGDSMDVTNPATGAVVHIINTATVAAVGAARRRARVLGSVVEEVPRVAPRDRLVV